nr:shikimate kinase [Chlamydia sp. 17-3921]
MEKPRWVKLLLNFCLFFFDTDDLIVRNYGHGLHCTISEIFTAHGNEIFYQWETQILRTLPSNDCVVALGGGTVMYEEAYQEIQNQGLLVFLSLPLPIIYKRLQARGLPERLKKAKSKEHLEAILQARIEHMKKISNYIFPVDNVNLSNPDSVKKTCEALYALLI